MDKVRFGFFERLKGDDSLLFFGSGPALQALHDVLFNLQGNAEVKLSNDERFLSLRGEEVLISLTDEIGSGMHYAKNGKLVFKWTIANYGMRDMLEKISNVLVSPRRCHNYLDGEIDEVQVIVSKDEYRLLDGELIMEDPLKWAEISSDK